jgi:DNA-binding GntR family transcriptional regulator
MASFGDRSAERPGVHNNAELAYRRLRERLVSGHYQPGNRLTELGICEDLGMSRTPVREALRRLQSDGLVTATGRGVVVSSLSQEEIQHALELHGALDALAARLTATAQRDGRLSPAQVTELQDAGHRVAERGAADDAKGVWRANIDFHMLLAHLSGNPLLEDTIERTWARFAIVSLSNISHRSNLTPVHHDAIVAAIVAGEPEQAAEAAAEHVREGAAMYIEGSADRDGDRTSR